MTLSMAVHDAGGVMLMILVPAMVLAWVFTRRPTQAEIREWERTHGNDR